MGEPHGGDLLPLGVQSLPLYRGWGRDGVKDPGMPPAPPTPPAPPAQTSGRGAKPSQTLYLIVGAAVLAAPVVLMMVILLGNLANHEDAIRGNIERVKQAEDAAALEKARQRRELQARMDAHFKACLAQKKFDDAEKALESMKLVELDPAFLEASEAALKKARSEK